MKIKIRIMSITTIFCLITACNSYMNVEREFEVPMSSLEQTLKPYKIQLGDELDIKFFYNPELNETIIVRPDGMISLQLIDDVKAVGLEPAELDKLLTEKYRNELRKPVLTVMVRSFSRQRIFVGGEVINQGLIDLKPGLSAVQAVFQAGGFKETAMPKETIVIRKGEENKPIPFLLDLDKAMYGRGEATAFELQPDDIIFVPKSEIAKINKFVEEYIQGMLMFNGWSFGIGYDLDNNN